MDTSFIFAYYNEDDYFHENSVKIMQELQKIGHLVISDYIFDELITISLSKLKDLDKVVQVGDDVLSYVDLVYVHEDDFKEIWEIFKTQKNTKLSFTDCSILTVMRERGIKNLATFDEDFLKINDIKVIR